MEHASNAIAWNLVLNMDQPLCGIGNGFGCDINLDVAQEGGLRADEFGLHGTVGIDIRKPEWHGGDGDLRSPDRFRNRCKHRFLGAACQLGRYSNQLRLSEIRFPPAWSKKLPLSQVEVTPVRHDWPLLPCQGASGQLQRD